MGRFARQFEELYRPLRENIYVFCRAMNFNPTKQQCELLDAVQRGVLKIAVKSGQGPGKSTVSVIIALWRCLRDVNALTILTAPTMRQCRDVWLAEARRLMMNADPILRRMIVVTQTKIMILDQPDWGVKTVTASKDENAQGFHEKNMTIICEEASGIPRKIIEQFKGTASNPNCLFLMIGNPNTRDCSFFDCFNSQRNQWHTITFNAEHTPKSEWFDPARNLALAEEFGRDSDVYRIRVLGEFPFADPNCVVSSEDLEKCSDKALRILCSRMMRHEDYGGGYARQIGLDFARYGGDESTCYQRSGNAILDWCKFSHTEPSDVVSRAFRMQLDAHWGNNDCLYIADAGGIGQGVMSKFHDSKKRVHEFHNGGRANRFRAYENKITEAWFQFSKLIKAKEAYIPADNTLIQQLSSRRYFTNKKGQLVLEKKDDYIDRGYDSPDRAEGVIYSFYDGAEATTHRSGVGGEQHTIGSSTAA